MVLDPLSVARKVTQVFERMGLRYSIGGSMASAFAGEPRATLDVDIVVDLRQHHLDPLLAQVADEFYLDAAALGRAVEQRTSVNLIHSTSSVKIDLFMAGGTPLDESLLQRRRMVVIGDPPQQTYIHSPEDILLQKLRWFRRGGEASDRQWRDILGIVRAQGQRLETAYLRDGAELLDVVDLLERALAG